MAKINLKNNKAKISILFLIGFLLFSFSRLVLADVVINEVQLSPTEGRFLELYNTGNEVVDLTGWYMQRQTSSGGSFSSLVSKPNFEGKTIGANDLFVISRSSLNNSDIVLSTLTLTESNTIQIKKSEEEIIDIICWGENCGEVANPTEGKSIQKIGSSWAISIPTPGEENQSSSNNYEEEENISNDEEEEISEVKKQIPQKLQKPKVQITNKQIAYVGIPFLLEGSGTDEFGDKISHGRYFWNFGDGDFREVKVMNTDKFTHTYFYPGDYNVTLEYFPDSFADTPVAVGKITVKVITPEVLISAVGDEKDFFVELSNKTSNEVDISNWVLLSDYRVFKIPRNTIIQANKKIIISPKLTNFSIIDKNTLRLMTAEGNLATNYSTSLAKIQPLKSPLSGGLTNPSSSDKGRSGGVVNNFDDTDEQINYLPALANEKVASSTIFYLIFFIFISFCAGAVYFIRRNKAVPEGYEDFEILDE